MELLQILAMIVSGFGLLWLLVFTAEKIMDNYAYSPKLYPILGMIFIIIVWVISTILLEIFLYNRWFA